MDLTVLDFVIFIVLALYFLVGIRRGFFISLGTLGGFVLGAVAAFYLTPWVIENVSTGWYIIAALFTVMFCLLIGQWVGYIVGSLLRRASDATPLRGFERLAGGVLNILVCLLLLVVGSLIVRPLAIAPVSTALSESVVMSWLHQQTPESVKNSLNQIRSQMISSGGIPEVRDILFPVQEVPQENLDNGNLQAASASVVQIFGTAQMCNYISEGSGFVAAPGYVVTNAHVVGGVSDPMVEDRDGNSYAGTVVYKDDAEDLAIIYTPDIPLPPLDLGSDVPAGTVVSFMGYPGGGPFSARPATVQGLGYTHTVNAETGESSESRLVYQLAAQVEQGNSGGPVLDENGMVVGVIFAKATQGEIGYAVPASVLADAMAGLASYTEAVPTGDCVMR